MDASSLNSHDLAALEALKAKRWRMDLISVAACVAAIGSGLAMGMLHEGQWFIVALVLLVSLSYLSTYMIDVSHLLTRQIRDIEYFQKHGHVPPSEVEECSGHDI